MLEAATEKAHVGQDRYGIGAILLIGLRQMEWIEIAGKKALARTLFFDLGNQTQTIGMAEHSCKRSKRRRLIALKQQGRKRYFGFLALNFNTFMGEDLVEYV